MKVGTALLITVVLLNTAQAQDNVLLIVIDDVGIDRIPVYAGNPNAGNTPNIDKLAGRGLLFRNAWSNPVCSPTRSTILTGRYSFRTGIGEPIGPADRGLGLALSEVTIPEILPPNYRTAVIGKWHLGSKSQGPTHPLLSGFDHHSGPLYNVPDYYFWSKYVDGVPERSTTYVTTDTANDAVSAIRAARSDGDPWFHWVAFNASHTPIHPPPPELHSFSLSGDPLVTRTMHNKAMTEALDTEIGRILAEVDFESTTVIFVGDNGATGTGGKGTVYEGGINVPLIIAGPDVAVGESHALVNTTDLFATVADLAGTTNTSPDSVSLVPYFADPSLPSIRQLVFAETFTPNGPGPYKRYDKAIRDLRYKVILDALSGRQEFYDLSTDRIEKAIC